VDRFRPQPVGLDVDRGALKAVQLARGGGGFSLQHVGYRKLPPGVVEEGEVADHDLLAAELRELWSSHSFKGKSVALGISNQRVVVRILDFPRMSPEDLGSAIIFEAQDQIPMPLEEAVMDHVVLGPREEGSDLDRVLIVAAQREMIERYTSAVRTAGLRPAGVDVKGLALTRSVLAGQQPEGEGAVLLLDVGSEMTNLVVTQDGDPVLTRFLGLGSIFFTSLIAQTAGIPEDEAEKQLMNPRVRLGYDAEEELEVEGEEGEFDPALDYDVRRALEDGAQTLAEDVQTSVEYHYSQPDAREVSQAYISGEGALVSGMDRYLGELLGVPTERGSPLSRLSGNRSNVTGEQLGVMEPVLAVAIGLALEES
jgi:type IV pilus assembly protein PilM